MARQAAWTPPCTDDGDTFFSGRGADTASKTNEKLFVSVLSRRPASTRRR